MLDNAFTDEIYSDSNMVLVKDDVIDFIEYVIN